MMMCLRFVAVGEVVLFSEGFEGVRLCVFLV